MNNIININNKKLPKLLLATTNAGKQRELRSLLEDYPIQLVVPSDLGISIEVPETGLTYDENASIKAQAFFEASGIAVVSDDTGLEVDALNGAPGLHSARYSTLPGATDADRRKKLLDALKGTPQPWIARFCCTVAVASPGRKIELFRGSVEGVIINQESGNHGFGYDRLFWVPEAGKTMADLTLDEKNSYSHRAAAVKKSIPYILKILSE